jgi:hypothetical protein
MAEDKLEQREFNFRQAFPWTELFQGFRVALDPKKLLLAAAGIVAMALGWFVLSWLFVAAEAKPQPNDPAYTELRNRDDSNAGKHAWQRFREDRTKWNILWKYAGDDSDRYEDAADLAQSYDQYEAKNADGKSFSEVVNGEIQQMKARGEAHRTITFNDKPFTIRERPFGELRTLPWFEDRGPNPYLLVTGQTNVAADGLGQWFLTREVPVLIEPLRKFLLPVLGLLTPGSGALNSIYFLLVIVWTLIVWGYVGGAITRMASVQVARGEKVSMREALRFVRTRFVSFFCAPLIPLLFIAVVVVGLSIYGAFFMIPWLGDIVVGGLGWPLVILAGLMMAIVLVGLVGWPMMYATISAEGSDSFDAISRSYSYVYQAPWSYAWYSLVALAYGAAVVFFVGFMGSMVVYLGKWGVSQTPFIQKAGRDPSFLFSYAPTSFGWRALLLEGAQTTDGHNVVTNGQINYPVEQEFRANLTWYNRVGAGIVAAWLYLFFLMIVGFGYSYFWGASTIVYLLMRRKVDDTDLDEVYLEEDDMEEAYASASSMTAPVVPPSPTGPQVTMVQTPSLITRTPAPPPPPHTPEPTAQAPVSTSTDGDKPASDSGPTS